MGEGGRGSAHRKLNSIPNQFVAEGSDWQELYVFIMGSVGDYFSYSSAGASNWSIMHRPIFRCGPWFNKGSNDEYSD